jgi:hypothetical protein
VLVGLQGNPMGAHEAAQALFRRVIEENDYLRAIAEGNTRNEWAQAILDQSRQIPTARDFLENALRGYRTLPEAIDGASRHGMTEEHATMIYQNQGRPMTVRRITQGLARGGQFKPEPGELTDPYMAAIVEGSLKPAYYDLEYANRYALPSVFTMRQLAASGVWSEAKTAERLKWAGWFPQDADEAAKAWAGSSEGGADALTKKAQVQLWTATHRAYVNDEMTAATARTELAAIGADADAQTAVLALWNREREVVRLSLTASQIKRAFSDAIFTRDEAIARLERLGMTPADAGILLDE